MFPRQSSRSSMLSRVPSEICLAPSAVRTSRGDPGADGVPSKSDDLGTLDSIRRRVQSFGGRTWRTVGAAQPDVTSD